jgi:hypothetical protein
MKTSIFDMNFTLPPIVEMTEVMKDMPAYHTQGNPYLWSLGCRFTC